MNSVMSGNRLCAVKNHMARINELIGVVSGVLDCNSPKYHIGCRYK